MSRPLLLVSLVTLGGLVRSAAADKQIQDMTPGYAKEAASCSAQRSGLSKIVSGGTELSAGTDASVAADVAIVQAELTVVQQYCDELDGLVATLKEHADGKYKAIERDLDARDNRVRKLRKQSKQLVDKNQPTVRKLIAQIAKRPQGGSTASGGATIGPKATPATFPSHRAIELPPLPGSWKLSGTSITDTVEYADKGVTASVTTRAFTAATCDQQRAALAKRTPDLADLVAPPSGRELGIQWSVRAVRKDKQPHLVSSMCVAVGSGGVIATSDVTPADRTALADQLTAVMLSMIAAQTTPAATP